MRLLIDECVPRKLKSFFEPQGYECETVQDVGFSGKTNGELLKLAEDNFDVLVTVDRNIQYQQNVTNRKIAILILCASSNDIGDISRLVPDAVTALRSIRQGQVVEVQPNRQAESNQD
jgi:predicted nuclease of predicted toxin-antitoxin system